MPGDWPLVCPITTRQCLTSPLTSGTWPLFYLFDSESAPMRLTDKQAILALAQSPIVPGLHHLSNRAFLAHQPAESPFSVSRVVGSGATRVQVAEQQDPRTAHSGTPGGYPGLCDCSTSYYID